MSNEIYIPSNFTIDDVIQYVKIPEEVRNYWRQLREESITLKMRFARLKDIMKLFKTKTITVGSLSI